MLAIWQVYNPKPWVGRKGRQVLADEGGVPNGMQSLALHEMFPEAPTTAAGRLIGSGGHWPWVREHLDARRKRGIEEATAPPTGTMGMVVCVAGARLWDPPAPPVGAAVHIPTAGVVPATAPGDFMDTETIRYPSHYPLLFVTYHVHAYCIRPWLCPATALVTGSSGRQYSYSLAEPRSPLTMRFKMPIFMRS